MGKKERSWLVPSEKGRIRRYFLSNWKVVQHLGNPLKAVEVCTVE
jgi:hypothetical protein